MPISLTCVNVRPKFIVRQAGEENMKKAFIVFLLSAVFSLKSYAQETKKYTYPIEEYTNPIELVNAVVTNARDNDERKRRSLSFTKTYTVHELDANGTPKMEKIGEREIVHERAGKKSEPPPIDINRVLAINYHFRFDDNKFQILNGKLHYVLHFWPKEKLPDGENGYYDAANRLSGTVYIDAEHLYLRRLVAVMDKPFNVVWPLGRIRRIELTLEQELRPDLDNLVIVNHFTVDSVRYRRLFSEKFEKHAYVYTDYKLVQ